MWTFDDFDAWGEAISGASLRLANDGVERREWTLGMVDLGSVVLQVASEGGGTICYGGNTHAGTLLFLPLTHAAEHVANGERLDDESLFVIPRGADFRIHLRRHAHAWCSIALPGNAEPWPGTTAASGRVACGGRSIARLRSRVTDVVASLIGRGVGTAAHRTAAADVLAAVADCMPERSAVSRATGRPRLDRGEIVRSAMDVIDAATVAPTAADLATSVGVTSRTLLRTFHESFGVSPKRYLMLRQLHDVRRRLRGSATDDATVADVLATHGVWEFGRFAARYRRHFGELPSQTLRRERG
ncbi:MAG: helix-turn-helix domain-containing protein [Planctomycetaceae bacterium]